jgi:hypothetical protein
MLAYGTGFSASRRRERHLDWSERHTPVNTRGDFCGSSAEPRAEQSARVPVRSVTQARGGGHLAPTSCRRAQELAVELASLIDRDLEARERDELGHPSRSACGPCRCAYPTPCAHRGDTAGGTRFAGSRAARSGSAARSAASSSPTASTLPPLCRVAGRREPRTVPRACQPVGLMTRQPDTRPCAGRLRRAAPGEPTAGEMRLTASVGRRTLTVTRLRLHDACG